jgi:hypothetical protein
MFDDVMDRLRSGPSHAEFLGQLKSNLGLGPKPKPIPVSPEFQAEFDFSQRVRDLQSGTKAPWSETLKNLKSDLKLSPEQQFDLDIERRVRDFQPGNQSPKSGTIGGRTKGNYTSFLMKRAVDDIEGNRAIEHRVSGFQNAPKKNYPLDPSSKKALDKVYKNDFKSFMGDVNAPVKDMPFPKSRLEEVLHKQESREFMREISSFTKPKEAIKSAGKRSLRFGLGFGLTGPHMRGAIGGAIGLGLGLSKGDSQSETANMRNALPYAAAGAGIGIMSSKFMMKTMGQVGSVLGGAGLYYGKHAKTVLGGMADAAVVSPIRKMHNKNLINEYKKMIGANYKGDTAAAVKAFGKTAKPFAIAGGVFLALAGLAAATFFASRKAVRATVDTVIPGSYNSGETGGLDFAPIPSTMRRNYDFENSTHGLVQGLSRRRHG